MATLDKTDPLRPDRSREIKLFLSQVFDRDDERELGSSLEQARRELPPGAAGE